jgi:hypothetical protein
VPGSHEDGFAFEFHEKNTHAQENSWPVERLVDLKKKYYVSWMVICRLFYDDVSSQVT